MRHRLLVSLLTLGSFCVLPGFGMVTGSIRVDVPFRFTVEKTALPAGRYVITPVSSNNPNILLIRSENGRRAVMFATDPVMPTAKNNPQGAELVFTRLGDQEYLTQVWDNTYDGNEIPGKWMRTGTGSQAAQLHAIPASKG